MDTGKHEPPLVGEHPYLGAARERAHPAPTADPQTVADLDRVQLAEQALAAALGAAGEAVASLALVLSAMGEGHRAHAAELARRIRALGGAPSVGGRDELPEPADRIAGLSDQGAIARALKADIRALVELYRSAIGRLPEADSDRALLAGFLAATTRDATRLERAG